MTITKHIIIIIFLHEFLLLISFKLLAALGLI